MKRQKLKMFGVFVLVTVFTLNKFNLSILKGATKTKTMTVTIGEGPLDVSTLSKTVNIPNLQGIVKIASNTGVVTYSINGENLAIHASGGTPIRSSNNPSKYSKVATKYKEDNLASLPNYLDYTDVDGFTGMLNKIGDPIKIRGGSRVIDTTTLYEPAGSPETSLHNIRHENSSTLFPDYSGPIVRITKTTPTWMEGVGWAGENSSDLVYKRFSGEIITVSRSKEGEYVKYTIVGTTPEEYRQNYSGTVYKAGIDNYYAYTVTIEYVDNQAPTIQAITSPTPGTVRSSVSGYTNLTVSGAVKDVDVGETLKVYYRINGTSGSAGVLLETLAANGSDQSFNGSVDVSSLSEGNHIVYIWVEDNAGERSTEVSRNFSLDKTAPVITIEPYITEWTNQDITIIATTNEGTLNQSSYTFTENGSFTFVATDSVGNQTEKTVTITNIDKNKPILTIKVGR